MKTCLFLLLMFISVNVMGQEEPLQCDTVIQAPGKSVSEIYTTVKAWVATSYNSANSVIQMDDAPNGIMICKGRFQYEAPGGINYQYMDGYVDYTLKIQVREGRYKVMVGNFIHQSTSPQFTKAWTFGQITESDEYQGKGDRRKKKVWPNLVISCKMEYMAIVVGLSGATSDNSGILDTDDDW